MEYYTRTNTGKTKVKGRRIQFKEYPELNLFYYQTKWCNYFICELESGCSLALGNQLKIAKERAVENIKNRGMAEIKTGIKESITQNGIANVFV